MDPRRDTQAANDTLPAATLPGERGAGEAMDDTAPREPIVLAERYEVLGLLGTGGMGSVYRVRDRQLDAVVALKLVRGDWSRPRWSSGFGRR